MEEYKKRLAGALAETGALFFDGGLVLKDGRPTPYFVNLGMFRTGRLAMELGAVFADMMVKQGLAGKIDIVLGPSYKGSALALSAAIALCRDHGRDLFFEYDRKEAKTHGEGSKGGGILVNKTLFDGCRVFVVDDVATSMGTKVDLMERVEEESVKAGLSIQWIGVGIAVDREQTTAVYDEKGRPVTGVKGENAIEAFTKRTGVPVFTVAGIREIVDYLFESRIPVNIRGESRPIDPGTKADFDTYLSLYGVEG
ncbi:MAG: orotate phosphoribosyltransferase [Thermodesulfobacteriota bacterium]